MAVGCEFKPYWGQFLTKFILFCVTSDLSDNLTEICIIKKLDYLNINRKKWHVEFLHNFNLNTNIPFNIW